jgi:hypothetical protein
LGLLFSANFEALLEELTTKTKTKDETLEGDVILIVKEITPDQTAADYAQVVSFTHDPTKRDEWWHVKLLFLAFPLMSAVFTLQTPHFTGKETFTMGGKKVFIKAVDPKAYDGQDEDAPPPGPPAPPGRPRGGPGSGPGFTLVK